MQGKVSKGNENTENTQQNEAPIQAKANEAGLVPTVFGYRPPIQTKEGKKPPIRAKHRPVQRNMGAAQKSTEIAQTLGQQHGVDTSPLQFKHNSSFPDTVNAEATIQGNKIDFAPGKDTEANIKHEVGHYIVNTQRGTPPKADAQVNGQAVNTTDEAAADKIMNTPLQRKADDTNTQQMAGRNQQTGVVQAQFEKGQKFADGLKRDRDHEDELRAIFRDDELFHEFMHVLHLRKGYNLTQWLRERNPRVAGQIRKIEQHINLRSKTQRRIQQVESQRHIPQRPFEYDEQEVMGQWDQGYTDANPKSRNETQKFGVEYEIKHTFIPFEPLQDEGNKFAGRPFYTFAVKQGHRPVYKHKTLPVEIHLDSGNGGEPGALLEVVTEPLTVGQMVDVNNWLSRSLHGISEPTGDLADTLREMPESGRYVHWLNKEFTPQNAEVHEYIEAHLDTTLDLKFHSMPQVTTTHTAHEMAGMRHFPTFMHAQGGGDSSRAYANLEQKRLREAGRGIEDYRERGRAMDNFIINHYLGGMKQYGEVPPEQINEEEHEEQSGGSIGKGKSAVAMVKHAAQQFGSYSGSDTIDTNPPVLRMDPYLGTDYELVNKLRTRANKPAPVFKRGNGQNAYVVEYRGGSGRNMPDTNLGDWIQSQGDHQGHHDAIDMEGMEHILGNALPRAYHRGKTLYEQIQRDSEQQIELNPRKKYDLKLYIAISGNPMLDILQEPATE